MHRAVTGLALALIPLSCSPGSTPGGQGLSGELDVLRSKHEAILQAHRDGDVESWLALEADDYISANRGVITFPTREERRAARGPYLEGARFDRYRDLREPLIMVSDDGTLGWLIAEVEASGLRTLPGGRTEPIHFIAAWIELYRKEAGEWHLVGNVSNFRPEPASQP